LYDMTGINYPVSLDKIPKFEKQNNKAVNVFSYDIGVDKKGKQKPEFYAIYTSKNNDVDPDKWINLLLIKDKEDKNKFHYVLIKNLSGLLRQQFEDHKRYICNGCLHGFSSKEGLKTHISNGCHQFGQTTKLPSPTEAIEYTKFKNYAKMLKSPFVIYADFECLTQEVNEDNDDANTKKYQKHIPCGFCY